MPNSNAGDHAVKAGVAMRTIPPSPPECLGALPTTDIPVREGVGMLTNNNTRPSRTGAGAWAKTRWTVALLSVSISSPASGQPPKARESTATPDSAQAAGGKAIEAIDGPMTRVELVFSLPELLHKGIKDSGFGKVAEWAGEHGIAVTNSKLTEITIDTQARIIDHYISRSTLVEGVEISKVQTRSSPLVPPLQLQGPPTNPAALAIISDLQSRGWRGTSPQPPSPPIKAQPSRLDNAQLIPAAWKFAQDNKRQLDDVFRRAAEGTSIVIPATNGGKPTTYQVTPNLARPYGPTSRERERTTWKASPPAGSNGASMQRFNSPNQR